MIDRFLAPILNKSASRYPAVILYGPRQSGKTTLAKARFPGHACANLEHIGTRAFVRDTPDAMYPEVVYDGDNLDLSDGVAVRNVRAFRV